MKILGFELKRCPKPPRREETFEVDTELPGFESGLLQVCERFLMAENDIINLHTALNRVERKQSRWLEVLNEKAPSEMVASFKERGKQEEGAYRDGSRRVTNIATQPLSGEELPVDEEQIIF